jgi:hypothetical protein
MIAALRNTALDATLGGLVLALSACATFAQGGGGGGGGGGSGLRSTSFSIAGSLWSPASNGVTAPKGTATLSYDTAQTSRSLSVRLDNIYLADGTVLNVVFYDVIVSGTYYGTPIYTYVPHGVGTMTVSGGTASVSISTADGDEVPLFGPQGQIDVYMVDDAGTNTFDIAYGNYLMGGGRPGNP